MNVFEGQFRDTECWQSRYQRNHRKCGGKHIRCFPYCKDTHRSTTFCGHSLKFELAFVEGAPAASEDKYTMVTEFAPVNPSMEFMKLNQCHSELVSDRITCGTVVSSATLLSRVAARREAVIWYQHSIENNDDSDSDAGEIDSEGLPLFSLKDFKTVKSGKKVDITFNKEERAYHYGFVGSKSIKNVQHEVRALLFRREIDGTYECVSVFHSPKFNLFGRKSRARAKSTRSLGQTKAENINFSVQLNSIRPRLAEKREMEDFGVYESQEINNFKRSRKDSINCALDTLANPNVWQPKDNSNPFALLQTFDLMNMLPPAQMNPDPFNANLFKTSPACKFAAFAKWQSNLEGASLESALVSGIGNVARNIISQRLAGIIPPQSFAHFLADAVLRLPVFAGLHVDELEEISGVELNHLETVVQTQHEMNRLDGCAYFTYQPLQSFVTGFSGSWSRSGTLNLDHLLPSNSFSQKLSHKLQSFQMRFDTQGEEHFLYLQENDVLFDIGPKKMLLSGEVVKFPREEKSLFQESLGLRYYRCVVNMSLGHLVICSYYDNLKLLNIMRVKNQYEMEEVFVVFRRRRNWSGSMFDETSWEEAGRVCSWAQRV